MKVYTKTGDNGTTGLVGGARASKADLRIQALGDLDEANCHLGLLRATRLSETMDTLVARAQARLFETGSEVASIEGARVSYSAELGSIVEDLEGSMDEMEGTLEPLRQFVLPGGSPAGAQAHLARAVCRRAERSLVALSGTTPVRGDLLRFLNRLSDWLFVAARTLNRRDGCTETAWAKEDTAP